MSRYSAYAREFADVERRMQRLEQRLDRLGGMASRTAASGVASAAQATDRVSDALVAALTDIVDRFRGGTRDIGSEASRLGNDALRRVSTEIERRPLMTVAIAVGVGLLIGLSSARRH
jgi:ElaB/YqjD/DUF883 family membrane-anchored ribosome-binding protein